MTGKEGKHCNWAYVFPRALWHFKISFKLKYFVWNTLPFNCHFENSILLMFLSVQWKLIFKFYNYTFEWNYGFSFHCLSEVYTKAIRPNFMEVCIMGEENIHYISEWFWNHEKKLMFLVFLTERALLSQTYALVVLLLLL